MYKYFALFVLLLNLVAISLASSHSEAPGTAKNPTADITDFYMFQSYETGRNDYTVLLANAQPLQNPFGGPNYFSLSDDHFYEIYIDNDGDAIEDITLQFIYGNRLGGAEITGTFTVDDDDCSATSETVNSRHESISLPIGDVSAVTVPLKLVGQILYNQDGTFDDTFLNWREYYQLNWISGGDRDNGTPQAVTNANTGSTEFAKPFDYTGTKGIPEYARYANDHIHPIDIPGCDRDGRVFLGQRKEAFNIYLGGIFDLINFVPLEGAVGDCDANNDLAALNVDTFALEIPTECLTTGGTDVLGAWTGVRKLSHQGDSHVAGKQVSRLGNPLVNELFIGIDRKGDFNEAHPIDDPANFGTFVTHPTLPAIISILFADAFGVDNIAPTNFPRGDLVTTFLTGLPGLNQVRGDILAEILRLNTSIPPVPAAQQDHYGVIAGDAAGFPNGRRPGDDVVDVALRVVMGVLCHAGLGLCDPVDAPFGTQPYIDGAPLNALMLDDTFPFLTTPNPGATGTDRCAVLAPSDDDCPVIECPAPPPPVVCPPVDCPSDGINDDGFQPDEDDDDAGELVCDDDSSSFATSISVSFVLLLIVSVFLF